MIKHIHPATRIFIGLVIITLLLIYIAITLSEREENNLLREGGKQSQLQNRDQSPTGLEASHTLLDTKDWQEYIDPAYPLTFSHPKDWKINSSNNEHGFYDITLTGPSSKNSIDFYISPKEYLGLDGFKGKSFTIDGIPGQMISDALIGVKKGEYYYTFDGSFAPDQTDAFYTIIQTVRLDRK